MTRRLAILLGCLASLALAQEPTPVAPKPLPTHESNTQAPTPDASPAKPQIEKISDTKYQIGTLSLNPKTREIRFPAKVNMDDGMLEYLICLKQGKTHEALLITETSPTHLRMAFTLLRYPTSAELFALVDETGRMTDQYPTVAPSVKAGARIAIDVEWNADGSTHRLPVNDWILHSVKTTAMAAGPWLYTGSDFAEGKFLPEITGDIAAIMVVPAAILNFPGPDNDDNVWAAFKKRIPPVETPVTVIITPYSNTRPLPKP